MAKLSNKRKRMSQSQATTDLDEKTVSETQQDTLVIDESEVEQMLESILDEDEEALDVLSTVTELDVLLIELKDSLHPDALDRWSIEALRDYRDNGKRQSLTPRGNYRSERVRSIDLEQWTANELMDWLEGRIDAHSSVSEDLIIEEIYARWLIPSNWAVIDAKDHVLNHTVPATIHSGELINDRRRESSNLKDMTFSMLCSIYLGEVETKHSKEDALERLKTVWRSRSDEDLNEALEQYKNGRPLMTNNVEQLLNALDNRKKLFKEYGSQLTDQTVADNQRLFYNQLRRICKLEYAEFSEAWRSLLRYVDNNYQDLFVATRVRRGWTLLELSPGNIATFDRLITLITGTRNSSTRHEDVKAFNLDYILEFVLESKERENLLTFYEG